MKRKRRRSQQVIRKFGDAEAGLASGKPLAAVCQMLGISEQTYYRWKKQFGNMKADEAKRLASLEDENSRLKMLVAELSLDKAILTEALDVAKNL